MSFNSSSSFTLFNHVFIMFHMTSVFIKQCFLSYSTSLNSSYKLIKKYQITRYSFLLIVNFFLFPYFLPSFLSANFCCIEFIMFKNPRTKDVSETIFCAKILKQLSVQILFFFFNRFSLREFLSCFFYF